MLTMIVLWAFAFFRTQRFNVEFKRRHHDIIRRQPTIDLIRSLLPNHHVGLACC